MMGEHRIARLGDVCEIVSGTTPKSTVAEYWDGGIPWVTPAELTDDSHVIIDTVRTLTEAGVASKKLPLLPKGTVLLSSRAPIGKVAIAGCDMYCNQGFKNLVCSDAVFNEYLYFFLKSRNEQLQHMGHGATFKELSKKTLSEMLLPLPSMKLQREIANNLNTARAQIDLAKQMLAKADELIQSRFVEMFENKGYEEILSFKIMPEMRNGVSPSKKGKVSAKVLTLSAITQGDFDESAWKNGVFDDTPSLDKRVSSADFYMCRGNGNKNLVGAGAFSSKDYPELVFPDTMIAGKVNTDIVCMSYLFSVWQRPFIRKQIEGMARTTNGTYKVNQDMLSHIEVPLPPLALQNEFAEFVTQVESLKTTTRQQLDRLTTLYDSLAQRYFA